MVDVTYRTAREQDLERTYEVFVTASNDLAAAHKFPQEASHGAPPARALAFRRYALKHDAQRFWVAEAAGEIIGFGVGVLTRHICYLAALHVAPTYQDQGIGGKLLELCMGKENAPDARIRTTIADSLNPISNAIYARFGMYQWVPLIPLSGPIQTNSVALDPSFTRVAQPLTNDPDHLEALATIDRAVLGLHRENLEHQLWLAQPDSAGYLFGEPSNPAGYAYVSNTGAIGPVAVMQEADMAQAMTHCVVRAKEAGAARIHIKVPGLCRIGLRYLLDQGFHFGRPLIVLASEPFGQMNQYIISGSDALF